VSDALYTVEIEPEVRLWLDALSDQHYRQVEEKVDLLAEMPTMLGEPQTRHLGGKLRELRIRLGGNHVRITYWLAADRRIVLLTVFRKTRMREAAEIDRAHHAQKVCEAEHGPAHEIYTRSTEERGGR
jgi:mRNA-degrading endonuclease RelE of RelBE toxin-antitoxin system